MVADRHHRDDLAPVEKQGQRPLHDDRGLDRPSLLIDADDRTSKPRIIRLRADGEFLHEVMMGRDRFRRKAANAMLRQST